MVALTLSHEGAMLVARDEAWAADAVQVEIKSSVGAGDSFLGGLLFALCKDKPLDEALRYGAAAGAAALLSAGTSLASREDTERLLQQVKVEPI